LHNEEYYKKLRKKFTPRYCRVIFLLESPPVSGKYFYDDTGTVNEPLYKKMMRCFIPFNPIKKTNGLREFARLGYLIVYAVYFPLDHVKSNRKKREIVLENLDRLEKDLKSITKGRAVKIIIVGSELRELLENKLKENFYVINDGENVSFENRFGENSYSEKVRFLFNIHNINLEMYC
jgi:hypothetical protein